MKYVLFDPRIQFYIFSLENGTGFLIESCVALVIGLLMKYVAFIMSGQWPVKHQPVK